MLVEVKVIMIESPLIVILNLILLKNEFLYGLSMFTKSRISDLKFNKVVQLWGNDDEMLLRC